jgi:hypothetical protein
MGHHLLHPLEIQPTLIAALATLGIDSIKEAKGAQTQNATPSPWRMEPKP